MTERRNADRTMTLKALAKIVRAQERGTLSEGLYIRRLPTQIVLENGIATDLAWIKKHFPGTEELHLEATKRGMGKSKRLYDEYRHLSLLREQAEFETTPSWVPRVEVWGILWPHECRRWNGHAHANGTVSWRCASYSCQKKITLTRARELGLLPPRASS